MAKTEKQNGEAKDKAVEVRPVCGIIMPISAVANYPATHWAEVKSILDEVIEAAGFAPNLVSDANEVSIIHSRIVGNISENPIMVCDVSSKNPNVMFELGLRLAFDKPTIIIKDRETDYNFDTSPIEHLPYPRDLRYSAVVEFKEVLKKKILDTYEKGKDPNYSTFLKEFIRLKPKTDNAKEVSLLDYIQKEFSEINKQLAQISISKVPTPLVRRFKGESNYATLSNVFNRWCEMTELPASTDLPQLHEFAYESFSAFFHNFLGRKMSEAESVLAHNRIRRYLIEATQSSET